MSPEPPSDPETTRVIRVVAAVIERDGQYLITRRRPSAVLPLMWEFPGGKVEDGEPDNVALQREVRHRLGVEIEVNGLMNFVSHPYEKYTVKLFLYTCRLASGEPQALNVHEFRWAFSSEFDNIAFTPADERSMSQLLGLN
jgi:8-oxo-dGTP diphosphatase